MARSGWSAAIRSSNRIYEKSPSDPRCSPRIANHLRRCSTTESRLALAVERVFQQPARSGSRVCIASLRAAMRPANAFEIAPMEHAFGLYTHIQSNKRRSIALLIGLFLLVYVMVYAGALVAEVFTTDAPLDYLLRAALRDLITALPWATLGAALWI